MQCECKRDVIDQNFLCAIVFRIHVRGSASHLHQNTTTRLIYPANHRTMVTQALQARIVTKLECLKHELSWWGTKSEVQSNWMERMNLGRLLEAEPQEARTRPCRIGSESILIRNILRKTQGILLWCLVKPGILHDVFVR